MFDGFLEFAEDDKMAGFRLSEIQLYNWGTFHEKIVTLNPEGKNSLLTGDIGSGKSTIVDAITTLLVPSHKVAYNRAAGADFKERSLRSYVMGYYKSERSEGGYSTRPVPLRKAGTTYSVILGVFHNEALSQTVSLAQVFFQKDSNGQPDRFFVVGDRRLSIREDLSDFGKELTILKKRLRKEESIEVYNRFPEYGAAFRRRFGLKNAQALELFHQTVSLKTVGNLTSFVQSHMLEPFDAVTPIDNLIHHFENLDKAHNAILRAKRQIQILSPLVDNLDRYQALEQEINEKVKIRNELKYYIAESKRLLLDDRLDKELELQRRHQQKLEHSDALIRSLQGQRDEVTQSIAAKGGARLEILYNKKESTERERDSKMRRSEEYEAVAKRLGLSPLIGIDQFNDNMMTARNRMTDVFDERNIIEQQLSETDYEKRKLHDEQTALIDEITSLTGRKSNIDRRQIEIRERLCNALSLNESSLPFIGEMLSVKPHQQKWEGAIERVLRSFALTLLVPDNLYEKISQWVDSTHLKGRLVYYRMSDKDVKKPKDILPGSIVEKLMIKEDNACHAWLEKELAHRYWDCICCENMQEFRRVSRGITRSGQIKGSAIHHEKDDRFVISDRRRYVLGWVNTSKLTELERLKVNNDLSLSQLGTKIAELQKKKTRLESEIQDLKRITDYTQYEELDWKGPAHSIEEILSEIKLIESNSDILETLQQKLSQIHSDLVSETNQKNELLIKAGRIENKIESIREQLSIIEDLLKQTPTAIDTIIADIGPLITEQFKDKTPNIDGLDHIERSFREELQADIDAAKKRLDRLRDSIISVMGDYNREYPSETREVDPSIEAGNEYRTMLNILVGENLPKFEDKFKVLLNENTIREIAGFQALLNKEHQQVKERVNQINRYLHGIDFNKDRYIVLEALNTNDVEIRTFRQDLKSCIEGSLGTEVPDQQYSETKFLQVKELINRFKGREGYSDLDKRWREKVTDVRSWFAFAASERWREDDLEYEHYTDSGGKSGGQKEKLAYTVLGASLAYQFGLEWGEVRSRSFRFVVIDEAFGRGSDESAHYGLDLFKRLNLQLLIVTPLQKIHIIEPYVSSVGFVYNPAGKESLLRNLSIEEYHHIKETYWDDVSTGRNQEAAD
ncbi:MAG: ATP-binding protein [Sphaerochaetaceae bacterium]|nr:ATP-binding protein [Sphaerochaetaceae bacterium]